MYDKSGSFDLENAFWRFSLRTYRRPDVPQACLYLQNGFGVDVNLLLFWVWSGLEAGIAADDDLLRKADDHVADWRTNMVLPLRSARSWAKTQPFMADEACVRLRDAVKRDELAAEQIQQAMLFRFSQHLLVNAQVSPQLARSNALAYLHPFAIANKDQGSEIISDFLAAID